MKAEHIIYIDETENDEYFIVAGFLAKGESLVNSAYKRFKKSIKGYPIPNRYKSKVYTEFKSTMLDRDYSRIKKRMLEEIAAIDGKIVYAYIKKENARQNQADKESAYIDLLHSMLNSLDQNVSVIFDRMQPLDFVTEIYPKDSLEHKVPSKAKYEIERYLKHIVKKYGLTTHDVYPN